MSAPTATIGATLSGSGVASAAASVVLSYRGLGGPGRLELTGAQTYDVDLVMMPAAGLKGLLIVLDPQDADGSPITAPVTLTWTSNSVQKSEELSAAPGKPGFFAICSPDPTNGIAALSITTTANAVVHVTALG